MSTPDINWEPLHQYPPSTIYCGCGEVFRSHAKGVGVDHKYIMYSERPCPKCGSNQDARRVSSDPEYQSL